jgi:hypothetical protein
VKLDTGLQSHLVIQQSDRQDSGLYVCQADNMFGHSKQTTLLAIQGIVHKKQPFLTVLNSEGVNGHILYFPNRFM